MVSHVRKLQPDGKFERVAVRHVIAPAAISRDRERFVARWAENSAQPGGVGNSVSGSLPERQERLTDDSKPFIVRFILWICVAGSRAVNAAT
jgi:hypothetical protein